jgi:hypothetical protein
VSSQLAGFASGLAASAAGGGGAGWAALGGVGEDVLAGASSARAAATAGSISKARNSFLTRDVPSPILG